MDTSVAEKPSHSFAKSLPTRALPCPALPCLQLARPLKGKVNNDFRFWLPYATFGMGEEELSHNKAQKLSQLPPSPGIWLSTWLLGAHTSKRVSRSDANKEVKHKKSAGGINALPASLPPSLLPPPLIHPHIHYQRQQQQQT